jgi:ABC-type transport system substrate-binding protein
MLQAVGIGISKVDVVDFPTWISRLNVGKYESTMNGWGNFAIDPRADLAAHFWSPTKAARGDGTGYKNDQVDQLFAQAAYGVNSCRANRSTFRAPICASRTPACTCRPFRSHIRPCISVALRR